LNEFLDKNAPTTGKKLAEGGNQEQASLRVRRSYISTNQHPEGCFFDTQK